LIAPQAGHHVPHDEDVNQDKEITQQTMQIDGQAWSGAFALFMIEGKLPHIEHEES
jgi:hypothetical protein